MSDLSPSISILLPAYNAERFLAETLETILGQTYTDFELILIDDGSRDKTLEIARSFEKRDSRVRVFTQPNSGIARTLNRATELAQHHWIARMDADDLMMPNRLERQLAFLQANPDLDVISSLVLYIDEHGATVGTGRSPFTNRRTIARYFRKNRMIAFNHPASMIRKSVLIEVGGYRPDFVPAEDCDLWNRIIERGHQVLVQPEYLLKYRVYSQSTIGQNVVAQERRLAWVRQCMILRRSGRPEATFAEFQESLTKESWAAKLNRKRAELGTACYGQAVFHISSGRYLSAMTRLTAATLLRPVFSLERIGPRLFGAMLRPFTKRVS